MSRYWVVRTDYKHLDDVILPSLKEGFLRQGWGYREDQNLETIGTLRRERGHKALNEHQRRTWKRVKRFWPGHSDRIQKGDRILLPKVPRRGCWRLVEVTGDYRFERHPVTCDHAHLLPVKTLIPVISSSNASVSASLQRTMRSQHPMWNIDGLTGDVERLLDEDPNQIMVADDATERLKGVLNDTLAGLIKRVRQDFRANQLEEPISRLLQLKFDRATVSKTAGSSEQGADFLVSETNSFGHERRTVVQLKDHPDMLNSTRALDQLREAAFAYKPVSGAVIIATARETDPDFETKREALEEELDIPVTTVLGDELARWFMAHLEVLAAD